MQHNSPLVDIALGDAFAQSKLKSSPSRLPKWRRQVKS
jgi:hypothetical protein